MKMITAIIRPHALELVRAGIQDIGISGLTVTEVKGYGRQKGHNEMYRGAEYTINFQPKIKLELVVGDDDVAKAKIFVSTLESAVRIRTGETGEAAI